MRIAENRQHCGTVEFAGGIYGAVIADENIWLPAVYPHN